MGTRTIRKYPFEPDYAVHPGEILLETIAAREIKKRDLANRLNMAVKTVSQILNGKARVTPETAIALERVLGISASIWNNLDAAFQLHMAKLREGAELESAAKWVKNFPYAVLAKRGYVETAKEYVRKADELLSFFGVANVDAWDSQYMDPSVAYRRSPSFEASPYSVAAWLRVGELKSEAVSTAAYDRARFQSALSDIRSLTVNTQEVFLPKIFSLCASAGIAVVVEPEIPKTHLAGATKWLSKNKALLMLSLRHKREDHFWFTFYHEAAHILNHGKKRIYIDGADFAGTDADEEEANRFARNILIPESQYSEWLRSPRDMFTKAEVVAFARSIGIAPGIVVGRLQHEKEIPFAWMNDLIRRFEIE